MNICTHERPYALRRHRHTRDGRTYDPDTDRKKHWLQLVEGLPNRPLHCALHASFVFSFKWPKRPKYAYPRKCDVDNMVKFYSDALNGRAFQDDAQIVSLEARKEYASADGVRIVLTPIQLPSPERLKEQQRQQAPEPACLPLQA